MKNRKYDKEFKKDSLRYCAEHQEMTQVEQTAKLGIPSKTLSRWLNESKRKGEDAFRGSGNYSSELAKENAALKRELRDTKDALEILKKAMGILGEKRQGFSRP